MTPEKQKEKMQSYLEDLINDLDTFELEEGSILENKLEFDLLSSEVRTVLKTIYHADIVSQCYTNHINDVIDKTVEKTYERCGF